MQTIAPIQPITIAAPFVREITRGVEQAGHDPIELLEKSQISPALLADELARVSLRQFIEFTHFVIEQLDDEAFGLLDRPRRRGSSKLLSLALLHCKNIEEAMVQSQDFHNALDNTLFHRFSIQEDLATYAIDLFPGSAIKSTYAIESSLLSAHRFSCWLAKRRFPLTKVTLSFSAPYYAREYRDLFYGAPVLFDQPHNSLQFDISYLQLTNKQNLKTLKRYLARAPLDMIIPIPQSNHFSVRVKQIIEERMRREHMVPELELVADELKLHPQTLRRRLKTEECNFQDLKTQAKRDLAIYLLSDTEMAVEQIAFQTGFSESSAFIRAFKSWTGTTPLAFRKA